MCNICFFVLICYKNIRDTKEILDKQQNIKENISKKTNYKIIENTKTRKHNRKSLKTYYKEINNNRN